MTNDEKNQLLQAAARGKEKFIQSAFLNTIKQLKIGLDDAEILKAIETNSIETILDAVQINKLSNLLVGIGIGDKQYNFSDMIRDSYIEGGKVGITLLPLDIQQLVNFDYLNYRAAYAMQNNGALLIRNITESTRNGLRATISDAIQNKVNPKSIAAEIRTQIGLTEPQAKAVSNYRRQLESRSNLGLTPAADRRLSAVEAAMTRRHMREGHFTQSKINQMVDTYSQRLLTKRALDISITESMAATNAGNYELYLQGLESGVLDSSYRKFWDVCLDDKLCPYCKPIPSMNAGGVALDGDFVTPFGLVKYPGYYHVRCRCSMHIEKVS